MTKIHASSSNKILAVLAHPDDEAFGMGGTLALYSSLGAQVYLICATLGEVGEVPAEFQQAGQTTAQLREAELRCSADALGMQNVFLLGYRESGMAGSPENHHPQALAAQPLEAVADRIADILRQVQPQVVLTFDPFGGYGHPDHIRIQQATVRAFEKVRSELSPDQNHWLNRLYFHTMPKGFLKMGIWMMRLQGKDPHRAGLNGDIDLIDIANHSYPTHARINYKLVEKQRAQAAACHASQGGAAKPAPLQAFLSRFVDHKTDLFMQAWPAPGPGKRVSADLLDGLPQ